jgi:hypothetical protein
MTDQNTQDAIEGNDDLPEEASELEQLRKQAKMMGISFSGNTGVETLRKKITDKLDGLDGANAATSNVTDVSDADDGDDTEAALTPAQQAKKIRDEALALVRIKYTCMNPGKGNLPGEIFCVANKVIGNVKRFIPYGAAAANGWHVERCLLDMMYAREYVHTYYEKDASAPNGKVRRTKMLPEFSIQELPPLTPKELADLAKAQAAGNNIDA